MTLSFGMYQSNARALCLSLETPYIISENLVSK